MSVRFSIVTICYNAAKDLPVTVESVLAQDLCDYEYIIQDGGSSDGTKELIGTYKERFLAKGIRLVFNSGPDKGIYDAMNRGAACAEGSYINFMNAGDCFYSGNVLKKVSDAMDLFSQKSGGTVPVIVYGDCAVFEYGRFYSFPKSLENIEENMPFSHQSVFAQREFVQEHPFKLEYRYSADYDFLLTAHDQGALFLDSDNIICITTADGFSSINYHDTLMESAQILKEHGKFHHTDRELSRRERSLKIRQFVLDHFPLWVKKFIRGYQIKKRGQNMEVKVPKWFEDMV